MGRNDHQDVADPSQVTWLADDPIKGVLLVDPLVGTR